MPMIRVRMLLKRQNLLKGETYTLEPAKARALISSEAAVLADPPAEVGRERAEAPEVEVR